MGSVNLYLDDVRENVPEVIDLPQNDDMLEVNELVNDSITQAAPKQNLTVASSVRELLECPVCLNAMYPPIHQVCHNPMLSSSI